MSTEEEAKHYGWGYRLAKSVVDHPWLSMGLGTLLFAAALIPMVVTGMRAGEIAETGSSDIEWPIIRPNFTHTAFFEPDDPLLVRFENFERRFGNDDAIVLVVHSPSGVFDLETGKLLAELTEKMWQVHDVIRVDSLANFNWVHGTEDDLIVEPLFPDDQPLTEDILKHRKGIALQHESLPDYLVTQDGNIAMLYARIKPGLDAPPNAPKIVEETRAVLASVEQGDHTFYVTGGPAINFAFEESAMGDQGKLVPMVLLLIVIFLTVLFRRVGAIVMPIAIIGVSISSAFAAAGWFNVEIGTITAVTLQAMVAIAVADSVHVLSTFYMTLNQGASKRDAAIYALAKNALPTLLTSITTAIGFLSFFSAILKPVVGLGIMCGFGTLVAWVYTYTILGGLMSLLPVVTRKKNKEAQSMVSSSNAVDIHPWARSYTQWLFNNRAAIFVVTSTLVVGSVFLASQVRVNSNPFEYFRPGYFVRDAQDFLNEKANGTANFEIIVSANKDEGIKEPEFMQRVEQFEAKVLDYKDVAKTVSMVDILRQMYRAWEGGNQDFYKIPESKEGIGQLMAQYESSLPQGMDVNDRMTQRKDAMRVTVISNITDSDEWVHAANDFEQFGAELGLDVKVTGKNYLYQNMNGYVVRSFVTSLSLAVVLISLLLIIIFRSVRTGITALLPNLVPLIVGAAVLRLINADLDIGTVLVASVCLGIAVDDTIHVVSNFMRYERQGLSAQDAIAAVMSKTAPALIVTSSVLVTGFGVLLFATFMPLVYFGLMVATVLSIALVIDLTFLPALLMSWVSRKGVTGAPAMSSAEPALSSEATV